MCQVHAAIDHIIWVVSELKVVAPQDIGFVAPYAGQVVLCREILQKVQTDKSSYNWQAIQVGISEFFQGREAPYMVVDLVRGGNDQGHLGFLSEARRLNLLFSRQKQAIVIFRDKDCVKPVETGDKKDDERTARNHNYINRHMLKTLEWLEKHGRRIDIPSDTLSDKYVNLKLSNEFDQASNGGDENVQM